MPATLLDKLLFPLIIPVVLGKTIYATVTGFFRGEEGAPAYGDHIINTMARTALGLLKVEQAQWLVPSIVETYKGWCSKNGVKPDIIDIPQTETRGFWMGNKDSAKYAMVYFHGGGYVIPGSFQHIDLLVNLLKWSNGDLAIFVVSYTLSPGVRYPVAIGECVEGLRYVLSITGRSPSNMVLGGDSAGGALVFAVISHVSGHPHPQNKLVKPLQFDGTLKSAFSICPLGSIDPKYPSWAKFAYRDNWPPSSGDYWMKTYLNGAPDDEYIYPSIATPDWWKNAKVASLLVTCGENEILRDAVLDLAAKYRQGAGADKIQVVIGQRETHIAPINPLGEAKLDELGPEKCQEAAVREWTRNLCKQ